MSTIHIEGLSNVSHLDNIQLAEQSCQYSILLYVVPLSPILFTKSGGRLPVSIKSCTRQPLLLIGLVIQSYLIICLPEDMHPPLPDSDSHEPILGELQTP